MSRRVTFETIRSGQDGAYADTVLIGRVTVEMNKGNGPWTMNPDYELERVKRLAKAFWGIHEPSDPGYSWASLNLMSMKVIGSGVWEIYARAIFTD